jgi:hypothetical protein
MLTERTNGRTNLERGSQLGQDYFQRRLEYLLGEAMPWRDTSKTVFMPETFLASSPISSSLFFSGSSGKFPVH